MQREGVKTSPDLASRLLCKAPLHKIRYGIVERPFGKTSVSSIAAFLIDAIIPARETYGKYTPTLSLDLGSLFYQHQ